MIGKTRCDGAARHAVKFGRHGILHQNKATRRANLFQTIRAIAACARQNDSDRAFALIRRKGPEQHINRVAVAAFFGGLDHVQSAVLHRQIAVRCNDIDMVGLDPHLIDNLKNLHCGMGGQHLRHLAFAVRVKMKHHYEGSPAIRRHCIEKPAERLDPPSRRPHADDKARLPVC